MAATKGGIVSNSGSSPGLGDSQPDVNHNVIPTQLCITYDPPQIGVVYKQNKNTKESNVYVIQLNSLIFIGEPIKITEILFKKHHNYLNPKRIKPEQVVKLVEKILIYFEQRLMEYEEEENGQGGEQDDLEYEDYEGH